MKFSSKIFNFALIIFLGIVILSCCFIKYSNIVEGARGLGNITRKCSDYGESGCPSGRCKVISTNGKNSWGGNIIVKKCVNK